MCIRDRDNSYGDEIWCCMPFCVQVEGIGVGGGCDCILVRKITVRQPDHSGQPQWEVSLKQTPAHTSFSRFHTTFDIYDFSSFCILTFCVRACIIIYGCFQ